MPLSRAWGYAWVGLLLGGLGAVVTVVSFSILFALEGWDLSGSKDELLDRKSFLAAGRILRARHIGLLSGRPFVIRYDFEYSVDEGPKMQGRSFLWTDGSWVTPGNRIAVEYLPSDHAVARVVDTRLTLFPTWLWPSLLAVFLICDAIAAVSLIRGLRRRTLLETGKVVAGRIVRVARKSWINPTPAILTYETTDPWTGQGIEADWWVRASRLTLSPAALPAPCWVVVADDLSGRSALLAFPGWQAWVAESVTLS